MPEFPVQSEGVDVERIMEQIRDRIRTNRDDGATAPDTQVRDGAAAPRGRQADRNKAGSARAPQPAPEPALPPAESFDFDQDTIYRSSRGALGSTLYNIRKLLSPVLKFFFNVQTMTHALAVQSRLNRRQAAFDDRVARLFETSSRRLEAREEIDKLNQQVMNDLVAEMTRLSVEMKNHRMLVESVAARLDFFERQAQARQVDAGTRADADAQPAVRSAAAGDAGGEGAEPARRRRRRGRRRTGRGAGSAAAAKDTATTDTAAAPAAEATPDGDSGTGDKAPAAEGAAPEAAPEAAPPTDQPAAPTEPETQPPDS